MKQLLIRAGIPLIEDVPDPCVEPGTLIVRSAASCVSIGTELANIAARRTPLWKKALDKPDLLRKALDSVLAKGLRRTFSDISGQQGEASPTGYSMAGIVVAVGDGVRGFAAGDRVACAGGQCAYHAELVRIPQNLAVAIPTGVTLQQASTVALGAIALQGVRRAEPTLGETFVVLGLGALGLFSVQLLKANGCRVLGLDPDLSRVEFAKRLGADRALCSGEAFQVREWLDANTGGAGADAVIITASSPSDDVVSSAFRSCRKKGRVIIVGDIGLDLRREDFYAKEIDLLISCSYGPGRYDPTYEDDGHDYPLPFVRWTENRNMSAFLSFVAEGKVRLESMIQLESPFTDAPEAFRRIHEDRPMLAILTHPTEQAPSPGKRVPSASRPPRGGKVRLGVIGAGGFARSVHLPNLVDLLGLADLRAVCNRTSHSAKNAADRFGSGYACTDYRLILDDPEIDAVLICTRHDQHAKLTLQALQAGKHVFVEKPTAVLPRELDELEAFHRTRLGTPLPILMTGYNRRFSPLAGRLKAELSTRTSPVALDYRMNAGQIPRDHWARGPEGGGRNIGEACHVYDLFGYLISAPSREAKATRIGLDDSLTDDFFATISFEDGSVATLLYSTLGSPREQKETLSANWDGKSFHLHDYRRFTRQVEAGAPWLQPRQDKGHRTCLEAFLRAIKDGEPSPIPVQEQFETARLAFAIEDQIRKPFH